MLTGSTLFVWEFVIDILETMEMVKADGVEKYIGLYVAQNEVPILRQKLQRLHNRSDKSDK